MSGLLIALCYRLIEYDLTATISNTASTLLILLGLLSGAWIYNR